MTNDIPPEGASGVKNTPDERTTAIPTPAEREDLRHRLSNGALSPTIALCFDLLSALDALEEQNKRLEAERDELERQQTRRDAQALGDLERLRQAELGRGATRALLFDMFSQFAYRNENEEYPWYDGGLSALEDAAAFLVAQGVLRESPKGRTYGLNPKSTEENGT